MMMQYLTDHRVVMGDSLLDIITYGHDMTHGHWPHAWPQHARVVIRHGSIAEV